jgi:hypothetical protein
MSLSSLPTDGILKVCKVVEEEASESGCCAGCAFLDSNVVLFYEHEREDHYRGKEGKVATTCPAPVIMSEDSLMMVPVELNVPLGCSHARFQPSWTCFPML